MFYSGILFFKKISYKDVNVTLKKTYKMPIYVHRFSFDIQSFIYNI